MAVHLPERTRDLTDKIPTNQNPSYYSLLLIVFRQIAHTNRIFNKHSLLGQSEYIAFFDYLQEN